MAKLSAKSKKSSSKTIDHDLISGRLNLREAIVKKQKELQIERKKYERTYIAKYKMQQGAKSKKSSSSKSDDLGQLNLRKHVIAKRRKYQAERKEYEQKYLARYQKQRNTKSKKKK